MPKRPERVALILLAACALGGCGAISFSRAAPSRVEAALAAASDTLRARAIAPGVRYVYAWDPRGPWAVHVVEVARRCAPVWQARKAGPPQTVRATTSALGRDALAAVNADFFAIPQGTTTGPHVTAGSVLIGPAQRPVVAFTRAGYWLGFPELEKPADPRLLPVEQVNRPRADTDGVRTRVFTHWFGSASPVDTLSRALRVRLLQSEQMGVIVTIDSAGGALQLDSVHAVVHVPRDYTFSPRDTLRWMLRIVPAGRTGQSDQVGLEVLGGFPLLVQNGVSVLAAQRGVRPEFGDQRHPRSAIAFTRDGNVLLIVVDGRQAPYSDGISLPELTDLALRLGARDALNFDGGGSSALVVQGSVVNRTSDRQGERAVGNALALVRCR